MPSCVCACSHGSSFHDIAGFEAAARNNPARLRFRNSSQSAPVQSDSICPSVLFAILTKRSIFDYPFNPSRTNCVGFDKNLLKNVLNCIDSISYWVRNVPIRAIHKTLNRL